MREENVPERVGLWNRSALRLLGRRFPATASSCIKQKQRCRYVKTSDSCSSKVFGRSNFPSGPAPVPGTPAQRAPVRETVVPTAIRTSSALRTEVSVDGPPCLLVAER